MVPCSLTVGTPAQIYSSVPGFRARPRGIYMKTTIPSFASSLNISTQDTGIFQVSTTFQAQNSRHLLTDSHTPSRDRTVFISHEDLGAHGGCCPRQTAALRFGLQPPDTKAVYNGALTDAVCPSIHPPGQKGSQGISHTSPSLFLQRT